MSAFEFQLHPIGSIQSSLHDRHQAPKQGNEGAPEAWLEISPTYAEALDGIAVGAEMIVITWLHEAQRDILKVHPRDDSHNPLTGVFATRSSDRPNPLGLHRVTVLDVIGNRLKVAPIEAIDGTPVVDLKPVLAHFIDA